MEEYPVGELVPMYVEIYGAQHEHVSVYAGVV